MSIRDIKFANLEQKFFEYAESNNHEAALSLIFRAADHVSRNRLHVGEALFFRQLDSCLEKLCRSPQFKREFRTGGPSRAAVDAAVIASEVYSAGGHGQIIKRLSLAMSSHLILTDPFFRLKCESKSDVPNNIGINFLSVLTLNNRSHVQKISQCLDFLEKLNPSIIFIVGHHQDVVPVAVGLMFADSRRTVFLHHADHLPSLGASIRFPAHFDFRSEIRSICDRFLQAADVLPTPVSEFGGTVEAPRGGMVLASSGTFIKFEGGGGGISYPDVVREILSHDLVDKYIHIGELSVAVSNSIRAEIYHNNLHKKFARVDRVPSVAEYLVHQGVNAYVASFPTSGVMAAAEAQSVGCPVIFPDDALAPRLCESESLYASTELSWSNFDELGRVIAEVGSNWDYFSTAAHQDYLARNSLECFRRKIENTKHLLS